MVAERPLGADGSVIPWFTYSAIAYLTQFDFADADVFEFGSGNSTLFWQQRVRSLVSIESDSAWHDEIAKVVDNSIVDYRLCTERDRYLSAISGGTYDIVIVDGDYREDCIAPAVAALRPGGFIILDNADWFPHQSAQLRSHGLLEVDFTGFGPINSYTSTTSLFMRRDVALRPIDVQPRVGFGGMPENVRS